MSEQIYITWNPWHGCTKYSEGCRYCYVYRQDEAYGSSVSSEQCRKTQNYNLPVKKKRDGSFKVEPGSIVMKGVAFQFHQTGAYFIKDGRMYRVPRRFQTLQARKAGIDYKIVDGYMPDI